ncbi:hypothetical protein ACLKA6_009016 [Drosophila palustris]
MLNPSGQLQHMQKGHGAETDAAQQLLLVVDVDVEDACYVKRPQKPLTRYEIERLLPRAKHATDGDWNAAKLATTFVGLLLLPVALTPCDENGNFLMAL